jgi:uroporphyrinogen-III decarboxylase
MEIYFMDLIEYREEIDRLHGIVAGMLEKVIVRAAGTGAEAVFYCEDLGVQDRTLVGPEMWRDIYKPHYERLTAAAHQRGMKVFMHSCGYNWALLEDLAKAGVDCFQFDQPSVYENVPLPELLKKYKIALFSPVDIQKVMPTGDRKFIESETVKLIERYKGSLILKNYGDLKGIGVKEDWDNWAYRKALKTAGLAETVSA